MKCKDASLSLKDLTGGRELEIFNVTRSDNVTYPALANRTQDCELNMVGKPVFHNYLDMKAGAWLRDPMLKDNATNEKIWLTKDDDLSHLHEYKNRNDYRQKKPSRNIPYKLSCPFKVSDQRKFQFKLLLKLFF
jgi:Olfactomedin-like domain